MPKSLKKLSLSIIIYSIILGYISFMAPGFISCIILTLLLFYLLRKNTPLEDKRYVLASISMALVLRVFTLIFLQNYCFSKGILDIFGDAADNIHRGQQLGNYLIGNSADIPFSISFKTYNAHILTIFNGIFFAFFRNDYFSLKYINILSVGITGWLIYDLTSKIYSQKAGKVAMSIVLFYPTLFLWSLTDLKESQINLAIVAMLWSLNMLTNSKGVKIRLISLILVIGSVSYAVFLRLSVMLPLIFAFFVILCFFYIINLTTSRNNLKKGLAVTILIISAFLLIYERKNIFETARTLYGQMISAHYGFLTSGGWNYDLLGSASQNYYTLKFFTKFIICGSLHFLLEPLPNHIFSLTIFLFYPVMILWYAVILFSILGIIKVLRFASFNNILPPAIFLFLYLTIVGPSIANIGTAVRLRDVIMPILAIFASFGLTRGQHQYLTYNERDI